MMRWMAVAMVLGSMGCVVYTADSADGQAGMQPAGEAPLITGAEAEFKPNYGDPYWRLSADIDVGDDPIDAVIMDVYDEACGKCLVDSIELFEEWEGRFRHDWHGSLDVLDPTYDGYVIEVHAIDDAGRWDVKEIWPH